MEAEGSVYIPFFRFSFSYLLTKNEFVFHFSFSNLKKEKRKTNSFFVFRFQICERKTDNEFLFRFSFSNLKNEKRKTNSFFVFAFRMLRSHCHYGWPIKIGSFGGILRSHWQRFENKLAEIASAKWYI